MPQYNYQAAADLALKEIVRAKIKHGDYKFVGAHHGYGVLLEEVDEMWDAIKADKIEQAVKEAVQVAAMAIRFIAELGDPEYIAHVHEKMSKWAFDETGEYKGNSAKTAMAALHTCEKSVLETALQAIK